MRFSRPACFITLMMSVVPLCSHAEDIRFPAGAPGIIDVTQAPYNVVAGTGVSASQQTANTAGINAAIEAARGYGSRRVVYLPNGTYLVNGTLFVNVDSTSNATAQSGCSMVTLQGQSRDGTVIKLADSTAGFQDVNNPAPLFSTYQAPNNGFTNTAFANNVFNLTLDIGANNPGAIGLRFISNNQGVVRDVLIRSSDATKRGWAGIDMEKTTLPGPALLKNVAIDGFDWAVRLASHSYSMTAEYLTISNQLVGGIRNQQNVLSVRKLTSTNTVSAIVNTDARGLITVIDSTFNGGNGSVPAIDNVAGVLFARNLASSGYTNVIRNRGSTVFGTSVTEFTSDSVLSLNPTPATSLNLPIEETPDAGWDDPATWTSVMSYGATPITVPFTYSQIGSLSNTGSDSSPAFQAAIDSMSGNRTTLFIPAGTYFFKTPVIVRGNVKRIVGAGAEIAFRNDFALTTQAAFVLQNTNFNTLTIERLFLSWASVSLKTHWFENQRTQTTVLRHLFIAKGQAYKAVQTSSTPIGKLFIEDVSSLAEYGSNGVNEPLAEARPQWLFGPGEKVWARQFNVEQPYTQIRNNGGTLWVLGHKTENYGPLLENLNGGSAEILGGFYHANKLTAYPTWPSSSNVASLPDVPVFINNSSNLSFVGRQDAGIDTKFNNIVQETRSGSTTTLTNTASGLVQYQGQSNKQWAVPLYVGYQGGVFVSTAATSLTEGGGTTTLTVNRGSNNTSQALTINYTLGGTATFGTDYTLTGATGLTGSVTIPAGQSSTSLTLAPVNDSTAEPARTITFTLQSGSGYSLGGNIAASLSLFDDDVLSPASVAKGVAPSGSTSQAVTVTNPAATSQTFTFALPSTSTYTYRTSKDVGGPTYEWVDISQLGTRQSGLEITGFNTAIVQNVALGFTFPFYGSNFTTVNVSNCGFVSFNDTALDFNPWTLPVGTGSNNFRGANNMIALFWRLINGDALARYYTYADTANQRFIVQYDNVYANSGTTRISAQLILFPSGEIRLQYKQYQLTDQQVSVGIQNGDKSQGLSIYAPYTTPTLLQDNLAIRILPPNTWLSASGLTNNTLTVPAGQSATFTVNLAAGFLPQAIYSYNLPITSSLGSQPALTLPITFQVAASAPSAPAGLAANALNATSVQLSWTDANTSETGLRLERSLSASDWSAATAIPLAANATSHTDTGLVGSTTYYYRIRAENLVGNSAFSATASATTPVLTVPNAPAGLSAIAASSSQINLSWTDGGGFTSNFRVERSLNGSTGWAQVGSLLSATTTSVSDTTVAADTTYYYRVFATNAAGASAASASASATTPGAPPATPANFAGNASSHTAIALTWTNVAAANYRLERAASSNGPFTQIATPGAGANGATDSGLTPSTTYYYRLAAENSNGLSAYTSTVSVATQPAPAPEAPSGLSVSGTTASGISLGWTDASAYETSFRIERSADGSTGWSEIANLAANTTAYTDSSLPASTTYYYRVRSANAAGFSAYSATVSGATSSGTLLFADSFAYTVGTNLTNQGGWTGSSSTANSTYINASNLSVFGLPAGAGGSINLGYGNAALATNTQKTKAYTAQAISNVFFSFLLRINNPGTLTNATPVWLAATYSNSNWPPNAAVYIRLNGADSTKIDVGMAKRDVTGANIQWVNGLAQNATHVIVSQYGGDGVSNGNDTGRLWVNPASSTFGAGSAPAATVSSTIGSDAAGQFNTLILNQSNLGSSAVILLDELRVGPTWADVTPPAPPLAAPGNLAVAAPTSSTQLTLSWTNSTGAASALEVSRSADGSTGWTVLTNSLASSATGYTDTGLSADSVWFYRVRALGAVANSGYTPAVSATTLTALQAWRYAAFGSSANTDNAADSADPDGDGVNNLLEYALAGSPVSSASHPAPVVGISDGTHLNLTFIRAKSDVTYIIQGTNDLSTWVDLATNPGSVGESVTFTDSVNLSSAVPPRRFLRLKVNVP